MLLQQNSFEQAYEFAEVHQLDFTLIHRRQVQWILQQWKEQFGKEDWMTFPAVDCGELFRLLRAAQSDLILYVLSSAFLPSFATTFEIIRFGEQNVKDENQKRMRVISLKWSLFAKLLYNKQHIDAQSWQVCLLVRLFEVVAFLSDDAAGTSGVFPL